MKAVILAAGKGSRLGDLTENMPKSLLQLNEKHSLLSYNFLQLKKSGINHILLVTGFQSLRIETEALKLASYYELHLEIVYNPFWDFCNVLGSLFMSLGKINDDFLFLHADTLAESIVYEQLISSPSRVCLAVDFKSCGDEEMKIWIRKNKLYRITKSDIGIKADGEFVGIAKFSREMEQFFRLKAIQLFQKGVLDSYIEKVLDDGLRHDNLVIDHFDASFFKTIEVDFPEDLDIARSLFTELPKS
jgi:L-glutamine-phosphate cytidylyltransferase